MAISQITSNSIAAGAVSASDLADGSISAVKLDTTGTANSSTYLRGDMAWSALPASGKVLQVVVSSVTSNFNTTSSSYVHATNHSLSITTTSANSKILLFCNTPLQMSANTLQAQSTFRSSLDSYTANLGETIQANYSDGNGGWKQISPLQYLHNAAQASGTSITYRVYIRRASG